MKKRGTAGLLGGALAVALLAGNVLGGSYPAYAQDTQYHDGNYTASSHVEFHEVVNYDLYVTVSVKDGVISKVALNDEKNADIEAVNVPYINYAMKGMADSYIGTTGTAADTVSGATYSSNAINEAVANAMAKSQANEADADTADTPSDDNGQNDNQNGSDSTNDTQKPSDDTANSGDTGNGNYERVLKTGAYVLTADSYDASAMMKMPAYIGIDMENKTFIVHPYKNNVVDTDTNKGSGSIAFDSSTGVYTMTYEAGVTVVALGSTTTFTVSDNGITFTSPLRYGAAQMNTTDADGNFLSYTAMPYTQETPNGDTTDNTQGTEDSENTSGSTSNDSTQSGESTENSASEDNANTAGQNSDSTQSGAQTSGNSTVKTGDSAMTGIYAVSAVLSIGLLIAAAVFKKRKRAL